MLARFGNSPGGRGHEYIINEGGDDGILVMSLRIVWAQDKNSPGKDGPARNGPAKTHSNIARPSQESYHCPEMAMILYH